MRHTDPFISTITVSLPTLAWQSKRANSTLVSGNGLNRRWGKPAWSKSGSCLNSPRKVYWWYSQSFHNAYCRRVPVELGCTVSHLALAWLAVKPTTSTIILGASKPEQILDNLKSLELIPKLTPAVLEKLETILDSKPSPRVSNSNITTQCRLSVSFLDDLWETRNTRCSSNTVARVSRRYCNYKAFTRLPKPDSHERSAKYNSLEIQYCHVKIFLYSLDRRNYVLHHLPVFFCVRIIISRDILPSLANVAYRPVGPVRCPYSVLLVFTFRLLPTRTVLSKRHFHRTHSINWICYSFSKTYWSLLASFMWQCPHASAAINTLSCFPGQIPNSFLVYILSGTCRVSVLYYKI